MRVFVGTPFVDASALRLSWRLVERRRPALEVLELATAGGTLELGVLGSSHQVSLFADGQRCTEVVACDGGPGPGLPSQATRRMGLVAYAFRATVRSLDDHELAAAVVSLVARYGDDPSGLVAVFPGLPHAATILAAEVKGPTVGWRTWHAYPQTAELVETCTEVVIG